MGFTLVNNEGSGAVLDDAVANYSYSEDVTSLEPSSISGGTGQVTITAISIDQDTIGSTHPNSNLLINNELTLTDSKRGSVNFRVKKISNSNGVISATGDTLNSRLNVVKTAQPHGGTGYTLLSAIQYYCSLVDIYPEIGEVATYGDLPIDVTDGFGYTVTATGKYYVGVAGVWVEKSYRLLFEAGLEATLEAIPVNFIGWNGNVWEHLKMLCAGVSISTTDNVGLETYIDGNALVFRVAKTSTIDLSEHVSTETISVDSFQSAGSVEVFNYNTSYGVNRIVQEQNRSNENLLVNRNVSITDAMQVDAGKTLTKRFKINATLEEVQQPTCVSQIIPLPYSGSTGQYVIVGNDNLPIEPAQWVGEGGSLSVSLTDVPDEIEITIVAPPLASLPIADDPATVTYSPYKIGVESSGDTDYPAMYIVGTGVFFDKTSKVFVSGASDSYTSKDSATNIDNPFITNAFNQAVRGVAAAQAVCGPNVTLNQSVYADLAFGQTPGMMQLLKSNKFRITSVSYDPGSSTINAVPCASFTDFNAKWGTLDFADFTAAAFDPAVNPSNALKFNEFTIIPLMEP